MEILSSVSLAVSSRTPLLSIVSIVSAFLTMFGHTVVDAAGSWNAEHGNLLTLNIGPKFPPSHTSHSNSEPVTLSCQYDVNPTGHIW
jgi:hypothetical protein